jgi:ribonuclease HII
MVTVAGVDEAGRGCVIGPLVIAGVLFQKEIIEELGHLGVKDSKKLTAKKRRELDIEIKDIAKEYNFFDLQPKEIDKVVNRGEPLRKLNYLEAMGMGKVIRDLRPDVAFVDPADVLVDRYVKQIRRVLPFKLHMVCEKHADDKFLVVSAASILAKVRRDQFIEDLRERYGDFGSGYCSDWKTIEYLESWFNEHDHCPSFIRASWSTVKRIRGA